jgi:hypothetical protein
LPGEKRATNDGTEGHDAADMTFADVRDTAVSDLPVVNDQSEIGSIDTVPEPTADRPASWDESVETDRPADSEDAVTGDRATPDAVANGDAPDLDSAIIDAPLLDAPSDERPATVTAPCTIRSIPVESVAKSCSAPDCPGIGCDKDASGALLMSYTICGASNPAWAVCELTLDEDMSTFDLSYGATGIIEVVFCVEEADLPGEVNLWYGRHPLRKKLALVTSGSVLPTGCYVRYFSPFQAQFPNWPETPESCRGACGSGHETCLGDFRTATETAAKDDGGVGYNLNATTVQLAAEGCASTDEGRRGHIRISWVKVLSDGCLCSDSSRCLGADRPVCRPADPQTCGPWPTDLPPGVCGPTQIGCAGPPGPGVACTVTVGGKTCQGLTECVEGRYLCPVSACQ